MNDKENKTKTTNLKPLINSIDFEPDYMDRLFKEDEIYRKALSTIKIFCDKNGIGRNSILINEDILVIIARKMTNPKIKEDNRLGLSAIQRALLEMHKDNKQKILKLDLT